MPPAHRPGPAHRPAGPPPPVSGRWRAGVRGSPIEHSLSPVLHRAAYAQLGLTDWDYDRARIEAAELPAHVAALDDTWRGLSLTMPLKEAALALADDVTPLAAAVGAANTLVRRPDGGWLADNTDVAGIVRALAEAGVAGAGAGLVVGSGATARSALAALRELGATRVWLAVRDTIRPDTARVAARLGLAVEPVPIGSWPAGVTVIVGTVPAAAYRGALGALPEPAGPAAVLDCVYGDGPSPLLGVATELGYTTVPGTEMLVHQAVEQVRLMTGLTPTADALRQALLSA